MELLGFVALPSFLAGQGLGLGLGFVAGVFFPGVLRKLRGLFELGKVTLVADAKGLEAKAKADVQAVEKRL